MKRYIRSKEDFIVHVDIPQPGTPEYARDERRRMQLELADEADAEEQADLEALSHKFQLGATYKLYRKDGQDAVREFRVINLSQKNMAIKVKGGINGIYNIKNSGDCQILLLGMGDRNYLSPSSKDIIRK